MTMQQFPAKWCQTEKLGPRPIYTPLHSPLPKVGVSSHEIQGVKNTFCNYGGSLKGPWKESGYRNIIRTMEGISMEGIISIYQRLRTNDMGIM